MRQNTPIQEQQQQSGRGNKDKGSSNSSSSSRWRLLLCAHCCNAAATATVRGRTDREREREREREPGEGPITRAPRTILCPSFPPFVTQDLILHTSISLRPSFPPFVTHSSFLSHFKFSPLLTCHSSSRTQDLGQQFSFTPQFLSAPPCHASAVRTSVVFFHTSNSLPLICRACSLGSSSLQYFFLWRILAILRKTFSKKKILPEIPFFIQNIQNFDKNRHDCLQHARVLKILYFRVFSIARFG